MVEYMSELQGFKSGLRKDAMRLFVQIGYKVQRWQCEQYQSWNALQRRPLEPWMRQYIAAQWTEFVDSVFWNIPVLEAAVQAVRAELLELQVDRYAAYCNEKYGRWDSP